MTPRIRQPALLLTLLVLAACSGAQTAQVIDSRGGQEILLINGVCIEIDKTGDEDSATRLPASQCGVE